VTLNDNDEDVCLYVCLSSLFCCTISRGPCANLLFSVVFIVTVYKFFVSISLYRLCFYCSYQFISSLFLLLVSVYTVFVFIARISL